jgi:hypothetical protein
LNSGPLVPQTHPAVGCRVKRSGGKCPISRKNIASG